MKIDVSFSHATRAAAYAEGQALRRKVSRTSHAVWKPEMRRADPMQTLLRTSRHRIASLLPLRYGRMSVSPFAYLRGCAAVMAADLAAVPTTGLRVQACGDCHLGNFGAFASPERRLLFDVMDFDETLPAPWEYDLKRLATSFTLVAREHGYNRGRVRDVTLAMVRSYREHVHEYAAMTPLEIWHAMIDSELLLRTAKTAAARRRREEFERKARARSSASLFDRLLVKRQVSLQFREAPPTIERLRRGTRLETAFRTALKRYPASLPDDRRTLLSRYHLADLAFKVVGVGSVGTRCAVALYLSADGEPLVLQIKEAVPSVLAPHCGQGAFKHQGERVVVGQRLMQCASDIFLGWASDDDGREYYVRQLRDMKTSVPLEMLVGGALVNFAGLCGWVLARAHSKVGDAARLCGYLGKSDRIDEAMADFAHAYADQCEQDYEAFLREIRAGRIPARIEARH